jgi:TM2 domain-containing membrane protein YozV
MSNFAVRPTIQCHACSRVIDAEAVVCTGCGVMQPAARALDADRTILPVFLLAFLFGALGVHRFFVGKVGTGILQFVTLGGLGIWWLVDMVMIVTGNFTDKEGNRITEWT